MIDTDKFASRHIGPRNKDIIEMLEIIGNQHSFSSSFSVPLRLCGSKKVFKGLVCNRT